VKRLSGGTSEQVSGVESVVSGMGVMAKQPASHPKQVSQQNPAIQTAPHLPRALSSAQLYHQSGDLSLQAYVPVAGTGAVTAISNTAASWRSIVYAESLLCVSPLQFHNLVTQKKKCKG
jgi:hypothetical protein